MNEKSRARKLARLEKLEDKLAIFDQRIVEYRQLFLEDDGIIDSKEQKCLNRLGRKTGRISNRISKLKTKLGVSDDAPIIEEPAVTVEPIVTVEPADISALEELQTALEELRTGAKNVLDSVDSGQSEIELTKEQIDTIEVYISKANDWFSAVAGEGQAVKDAFEAKYPNYNNELETNYQWIGNNFMPKVVLKVDKPTPVPASEDPMLSATSSLKGSVGVKGKNNPQDVVTVRSILNKFGNSLEIIETNDAKLEEAIKQFQRDYRGSSKPDGRVDAGGRTWGTLIGIGRIQGDLLKTAKKYGVDPAVILAIQSIESGGNGFLSDGRPKILFEGHVMWRQLKKVGKDPVKLSKGNEDILYPSFDRSKYKGGATEYTRLERAKKFDKEAALKSASWGEFQIMGFNHAKVGYSDVETFVEAMHGVGSNQLNAVMEFLKNNNLIRHVDGATKNWTKLAEGYNGKGQQGYDTKLEKAYARFSKLL